MTKLSHLDQIGKKGILPEVCKNCTRYEPVDNFIKKNKLQFKEPIKRVIKNIF